MTDKTIHDAVDGALSGNHGAYQIAPDERDPVCDETADEAWEKYQRRGLVNPFHAHELQRRQSEKRRKEQENEPSLYETLVEWDSE